MHEGLCYDGALHRRRGRQKRWNKRFERKGTVGLDESIIGWSDSRVGNNVGRPEEFVVPPRESEVPKRAGKFKYDLGQEFPSDFYYPEVFFKERPQIIPSPWIKRSNSYLIKASLTTPFKKIKRKFWRKKIGY